MDIKDAFKDTLAKKIEALAGGPEDDFCGGLTQDQAARIAQWAWDEAIKTAEAVCDAKVDNLWRAEQDAIKRTDTDEIRLKRGVARQLRDAIGALRLVFG